MKTRVINERQQDKVASDVDKNHNEKLDIAVTWHYVATDSVCKFPSRPLDKLSGTQS